MRVASTSCGLLVALLALCSGASADDNAAARTRTTTAPIAAKRTDDPTREPSSCDMPCKTTRSPVCGSDGKTYTNYCVFSVEACKDKTLALAYTAACKTLPPANDDDDDNDDDRVSSTQAPKSATTASTPVTRTSTTTPTTTPAAAHSVTIVVDTLRANDAAEANDVKDDACAPLCTREYVPVCGSDNVTYANECLFQAAKCRAHGQLHKRADGECPSHAL